MIRVLNYQSKGPIFKKYFFAPSSMQFFIFPEILAIYPGLPFWLTICWRRSFKGGCIPLPAMMFSFVRLNLGSESGKYFFPVLWNLSENYETVKRKEQDGWAATLH